MFNTKDHLLGGYPLKPLRLEMCPTVGHIFQYGATRNTSHGGTYFSYYEERMVPCDNEATLSGYGWEMENTAT